ncbi:formate dehydrogenase accessory sulfurtransferase FdhD [Actinomarinicola tropica]|uniref:Sulfur carrier protein FdhD n=1 Tax=Actinomarinicola tropica TaxID=2789776 RepID=A0A5Q2RRC2_9ACTN|nr:formate dehydrogenase accessory sulfurtransferase FdhD [Actinomarinicola tropica]QGG96450.1 sulfurtransferase FdhD [Actinomarinicola tropica]
MARGRTETFLTRTFDGDVGGRRPDQLVVEEPLEIRLDDVLVATTMRTPGHDFELAAGWCHAEGLLAGAPVETIRYCATGSAVETGFNVVSVSTRGRAPTPAPRLTASSSSCGLCGSDSIDDLVDRIGPIPGADAFRPEVLAGVPEAMREHQGLFDATGAVHAAAAFDATGHVAVAREDIGRHNAVDKVVGRLLLDGRLPAAGLGLAVSGRASFEMVQKAWAAGFPAVVAVSAPSALAVRTARRAGMTLAGFARDGALRIYAGPELEG